MINSGTIMKKIFSIYKKESDISAPLIANIPHSKTYIPGDATKTFLISINDYKKECLVMTDAYVDKLFSFIGKNYGIMICFNISRMVVDPERFEDDASEPMAKKGMGVIYEKTNDGKALKKKPTKKQREMLLEKYYRPYHKAIENEVEVLLDKFGKCLILDCHSFPSIALPYEDSSLKRQDICVGTDKYHTPKKIIKSVQNSCEKIGWSMVLNEPFSNTYVPLKYLGKNQNVISVMIEVNRKLYMNEKTGKKLGSFNSVKSNLSILVKELLNKI